MDVFLCVNSSENNAINKSIFTVKQVNAVMKNDSSIYQPVLIFQYDNTMEGVNYLSIPMWERFYFIDNISAMTGSRYEVRARCDVLESFKNDILSMQCIIEGTQNIGSNFYLPSDIWIRNVKSKTDIIPFSNGLLDNGEYILITAGG